MYCVLRVLFNQLTDYYYSLHSFHVNYVESFYRWQLIHLIWKSFEIITRNIKPKIKVKTEHNHDQNIMNLILKLVCFVCKMLNSYSALFFTSVDICVLCVVVVARVWKRKFISTKIGTGLLKMGKWLWEPKQKLNANRSNKKQLNAWYDKIWSFFFISTFWCLITIIINIYLRKRKQFANSNSNRT